LCDCAFSISLPISRLLLTASVLLFSDHRIEIIMGEIQSPTEKKAVRHAEKRRTSTCEFADRVAQVSVDQFNRIPEDERPSKTCMAAIVAHCDGELRVMSMGVGTKFMSESSLKEEIDSGCYGLRVRE
jgi:hypothetical protein